MTNRLLIVLLASLLAGSASTAFGQGIIQMSSSIDSNPGVKIVITVQDPPDLNCSWLGVVRGSFSDVHQSTNLIAMIQRQPGTTYTVQFRDFGAEPNTVYCYRMMVMLGPWQPEGACNFCQYFDCLCDVQTCINTGAQPVFIGSGYLSALNSGGETMELLSCDNPAQVIASFASVSGSALQYVDSGTPVAVYGQPYYVPCIWSWSATAATPQSCAVAIQSRTWGAVKALYRE